MRIRILATAVTSSDCYVRGLNLSFAYRIMARLALGWTAPRQPVLGMVLAGEVDSVGWDARLFDEGDKVFGFNRYRFGTYAQYVYWPEDGLLARRPANLTNEEAAAIPCGGLLALHFLRKTPVIRNYGSQMVPFQSRIESDIPACLPFAPSPTHNV